MIVPSVAEYPGALRTPRPINREKELQQVKDAIHDAGTRVIYFRGAGGIGKTYLLQAVLSWCQPGGEWHFEGLLAPPPELLVDLYHVTHHTLPGLTWALRQSLRASGESFRQFDEAYQEWQEKRFGLAGMLRELKTLSQRVGETFLDDLNALARTCRPVIVLDTIERLLYEEDVVQKRLDLEPDRIGALQWLLSALPQMENVAVLLAGRPDPARLFEELQEALGERLTIIDLGPFDLESTKAYLDAVAGALRQQGMEGQAERIDRIPEEAREVIWYYTEGRPIMLSLIADYLAVADILPAWAGESVEAVKALDEEQLKKKRLQAEADLVSFWQETSRSADQAIQALAWARKGMTPDLLARVLEADIETASRWLEDIQNFSFVKLRPADKRWFLHDEMYDLLERHVLSVLPEAYREQAYRAILEWYGEQVKAQRKKVWELLIPRRSGLPDWDVTPADLPRPPGQPEKLALETDRLYNLMAEEVHYRLLLQPQEGFQTCQLYAKEAFWVNQETQETLDHLLRSELLWFLNRYSDRETFDGLPRREMEVDIALHRLERFNRGSDPQTLEYARRIRQECMDIIGEAGPLAGIWLDILEGEALLYSGIELPQAEQLLTSAVGALESFQPSSPFEEWRRSTLQAEAYNDLGYLYRTLGWFQKADEWYRKAINLWRRLEDKEEDELRRMALRAQHANTLNNRAWALAELGRFDQAIRLAEDALEMRQALGPAAPIAFSQNTLGLILTRADQPHRARVHCSRALAIFRGLQQPRGVGLADIALGEALRRLSAIPDLYAPEECADLLREAEGYLNEAVEIFRPDGPVPEKPRLIEALIERGCLYRQWAWLRPLYEDEDPPQEELARRSERDLREAMELAGDEFPYRYLDAHVDLAWLYYYIRQEDRAEQEAREALKKVPTEYHFPLQTDPSQLPYTFYWFLMGKAYLLLGQVTERRFRSAKEKGRPKEEQQEFLRQVGEFYTIALACDEQFAQDFRDIRRAIRTIYDRLRRFNLEEMRAVHRGIADAVQKYGLSVPIRMDKVLADYTLPTRD